jgi:uncharacterized membrane protein YeaQ/YmgE (transglycosylase-associated protein family)
MSGQLSASQPTWQAPAEPKPSWRRLVIDAVSILIVSAVVGVAAGFVWERLWTPPSGLAYQGKWGLDGEGLPHDFSGTGLYALVAIVAGLLLGVVVALVFDRDEVVTLAAGVVGAALAGALMWLVGTALGPADPHTLAKAADDFEPIVSDLRVRGRGAFVAFPLGATLSAAAVFLLSARRRRAS